MWFFSVIDEAQILNFMNYFESKSFKAFSLYGLKETSGDEKRNSFSKELGFQTVKRYYARYIYLILLPLSQKAGREAFDKVDPLFAGL